MPFRFMKACRHKGRWINIAISFGIDLQEIFRLGIRHDTDNLATDDEDGGIVCDKYVILCGNLMPLTAL